jgi:hypothetical protein
MDEEVAREDQRELIEEEDDDSELEGESGVQLGYVEQGENALFADSDWRNWDGGRIGGTPVRCRHKCNPTVPSKLYTCVCYAGLVEPSGSAYYRSYNLQHVPAANAIRPTGWWWNARNSGTPQRYTSTFVLMLFRFTALLTIPRQAFTERCTSSAVVTGSVSKAAA